MTNQTQVQGDLQALLEDAINETGVSLQEGAAELAAYAAGRSAHLATLVDQPGFQEAVRAERDAVALKAGLVAVGNADAADARLVGIFQGALVMGARALTAGLA